MSGVVGGNGDRNGVSVTLEKDIQLASVVRERYGLGEKHRNGDRNDDTLSSASGTTEGIGDDTRGFRYPVAHAPQRVDRIGALLMERESRSRASGFRGGDTG